MRATRSWDLYRGGFAVWLLLTTFVCLNPHGAGPHLYGAHEDSSDQRPATVAPFGSSSITTSVPDQACDDEVPAVAPAKLFQDPATPPQAVAPDLMADVAHARGRL